VSPYSLSPTGTTEDVAWPLRTGHLEREAQTKPPFS
jgi:hypothetical protein